MKADYDLETHHKWWATRPNVVVTRDSITGALVVTGTPETLFEKQLVNAVGSNEIVVTLTTTRDKTVVGNDGVERVLTPGSYNGSTIDENGVVRTSQTLNVKLCKKEIAAGGIEPVGITVLHEVLESYFGGRSSPGQGFTKSAFLGAHGKALLVDTRAAGITAIVKNQSKGNRFTVTIEGTKVSWGGKYKTNNWPGRGNPFKDN